MLWSAQRPRGYRVELNEFDFDLMKDHVSWEWVSDLNVGRSMSQQAQPTQ